MGWAKYEEDNREIYEERYSIYNYNHPDRFSAYREQLTKAIGNVISKTAVDKIKISIE